MASMEWLLELVLVGLLIATMFHALRLERALGVLKRDRVALEELVAGFNASTRAAEHGIERLKEAADGAGRQIARQVDAATRLKDDLVFLSDRGEGLADRLDQLVRSARGLADPPMRSRATNLAAAPPAAVADRDGASWRDQVDARRDQNELVSATEDAGVRVQSQAERDLIRALRIAR